MRVGVIGVGVMGTQHARIYSQLKDVELIGVADIKESAKKIAKKHGCEYFKNYKELLKKTEAVSICVPTSLHKKICLNALRFNNHILVEKPITDNIPDALQIIKIAKERNLILMVGHVERFNPVVREIKRRIKEFGEIFSIFSQRVGVYPPRIKDVGVIIDLAVHDIDIMRYLLEKKVKKVYSLSRCILHNKREDISIINLEFENGCIGTIYVNWLTPTKIRKIDIIGSKKFGTADLITQTLFIYPNFGSEKFKSFEEFYNKYRELKGKRIKIEKKEPLKEELQHFIECIKKGKKPLVDGVEGLLTLKIAIRALRSRNK